MTTCPVVSCTWIVTDALPRLENILKLSIEDLIIDDATFHIHDYSARFQIIDHRSSLQINLAILTRIDVSEKATQRFIIDQWLIVLGMLSEGQFPETEPNLVSTLADLNSHDFSWHYYFWFVKKAW